jgi:hypothetical protein
MTLDACHHFGVGENAKSTIFNDVQIIPPNQTPNPHFIGPNFKP